MTSRYSRGRDAAHEDTDPDSFFSESRSKRTRRKDRQLCGQVQGAISAALGANFDDEVLNELWVVKVEPAPTVSRLMVWVAGPRGSNAELIMARLVRVSVALRAEVAAAISRKQVPTLSFAVCDGQTEDDVAASLERLKQRDGRLELGTLGRGNHFLEFQCDEANRLWLMVHSGSRAMGPAIREHHLRSVHVDRGLRWLDARSDAGARYIADVAWARRYARINRTTMFERIKELMRELFDAEAEPDTLIECDHNHVQCEQHEGVELWVHRKGALHAAEGVAGVIPGSMGTASYHVVGRGEPTALCSSSHGAGRVMSRTDARRRIARKHLLADVEGVWFDHRLAERLREEAPSAYKDIGAVMRAQQELTRIVRKLEPVLVYKGA